MTADDPADTHAAAARFESIPDRIEAHARAMPDVPALHVEGHTLSWQQLSAGMKQVAHALARAGIAPGDTVALLGLASTAYVECFLGTVAARACAVPLPGSATADTLEALLADCDARLLFIDAGTDDAITAMAQRLAARGALQVVALDASAAVGTPFATWRVAGEADAPLPAAQADDRFNIIYSSGTTGLPKGIVHLHGMRQQQAARGRFGYARGSRTLLSTPTYSNTTLLPMLGTLWHGGTCVLMRKFDTARFLALVPEHRITHTMLVPVQYKRLLAHPAFASSDLASLQVSQCTGAPIELPLKQEIASRWPGRFFEIYGLTEGGVTCILDAHAHPDKLGTVGQPAPGSDVFLIDDEGRRLPAGDVDAIGEVVGRSALMMAGYHRRPEATAQMQWHDADGRVHFRSGDVGRFDADGFLTLLDRIKDVVISGGHNIYPADLEAVLMRHDAVADAAVIGVPSEAWGETPLALVALRPGAQVDADALRDWLNAQVGKTQRVSAVELRPELPRSALGKLSKKALRAPYWPATTAVDASTDTSPSPSPQGAP